MYRYVAEEKTSRPPLHRARRVKQPATLRLNVFAVCLSPSILTFLSAKASASPSSAPENFPQILQIVPQISRNSFLKAFKRIRITLTTTRPSFNPSIPQSLNPSIPQSFNPYFPLCENRCFSFLCAVEFPADAADGFAENAAFFF
ncbi:MAG TPA: hypothetical protein PKE63_08295 [Lacibacter sp.]|nr:hypothetical protein [Lacibacter sp.]HMO89629.1 hypothetical protein [Lacibacter sp.]HMP87264.1 hypothetical protein [Lacibacter sp.]